MYVNKVIPYSLVAHSYSLMNNTINPEMAGVLHTEQNHLHGQRQEFRIRNNAQKTKENDVKMILISLAYLTLIKLLFCMRTGESERERELKKKKKSQNRSETILR